MRSPYFLGAILGRSLQDLVAFLSELRDLKVDLFLHKQGMDTTTPGGRMLFQTCGVFAVKKIQ